MEDITQAPAYVIGQMSARIDNLEKSVENMDKKLDTLLERSAEQKGGKGALAAWGGGGVSVGALVVAAAQWLGLGGQPQHTTETRTESSSVRESVPAPVHNSRD